MVYLLFILSELGIYNDFILEICFNILLQKEGEFLSESKCYILELFPKIYHKVDDTVKETILSRMGTALKSLDNMVRIYAAIGLAKIGNATKAHTNQLIATIESDNNRYVQRTVYHQC